MRLYFARHGESEANVLRVISNRGLVHPLTALGREQAAQLAQSLCDVPLVKIFCSPLLRARQTGEIVATTLNLPIETVDALREPDCGLAEGRADEAAWAEHQRASAAWFDDHNYAYRIAGGESFDDLRARFEPFIARLLMEYGETDQQLLLITHGALLCTMLSITLANATETFAEWRPIPNTALIVVERQSAGWVCVEWCGVKI